MLADLGFITILLAFIVGIYAAVAAFYGVRRSEQRWIVSARNASIAIFPLTLLACVLIVALLLLNDFSVEYVWRVTSIDTPTYLKISALWGGQAGSLLFWNMILAAFTAAAMMRKWDDQRALMPYALIVASITQIFFLFITVFVENPFARLDIVPADGNGLNPLLRHPGMIIHPPMLYLGFTGFTIPYVFAMAALISGRLDDVWIRTTRRWTLAAWLFLSLGLILGGRWAYDVLGWGGYWAWDPVENASFLPWLAGTAFLHSVMIQEKRNMFKMWNMVLIILTYLLVVWGTFIVRSGVISSVHSFAQSAIGPLFFGFLAIMLTFSIAWLLYRRDQLATPNHLQSVFSREGAFLANNFVILGILFATFIGTNFPILSELVTGEKITVGPPFYDRVNGPLFAVLLLLMGVAPLTMWYRTSIQRLGRGIIWPAVAATIFVVLLVVLGIDSAGALLGSWIVSFSAILTLHEFWKGTRARMRSRGEMPWTALAKLIGRNRRRYGGYWIHLGVLVMAFGVIGSTFFQQETQIRMQTGDVVSLGDYTMTFEGVTRFPGPDDLIITEANVAVYDDGKYIRNLQPRTELYTRSGQPMTIPKARSTIAEDFYVLLVNWEETSETVATLRIYLNPLINWVWAGGVIFIIGTFIAAWPDPKDVRVSKAVHAQQRSGVSPAGAVGD